MAERPLDVVVIGAGPGGYVAAIRAAQLGLSVAVVEKDEPGGVCLNRGCIPSKHLIHQAGSFLGLRTMQAVGVTVDASTLDYGKVQAGSRKVVRTLTDGVASLLKRNGVRYVRGYARIRAPGAVAVTGEQGEILLSCLNIVVATGSRPMEIPGFEFDHERVISSDDLLVLTRLPESMVILGAGAIGCEFAYVLNAFGVRVILVEALQHILPAEDFEPAAVVAGSFEKAGIDIRCQARAVKLERNEQSVSVTLEAPDGARDRVSAEKVLAVFGRTPITADLGLEEVGVALDDRGYVEIGSFNQTTVQGIYAIGDITRTPALAHVASREGEIVVEHIAGLVSECDRVDSSTVPSAIYCEPQLAGFGLREDRALEQGIDVKKSVFRYVGAGKTIAIGKPEGLVKILVDPATGEILGGHVVGHDATEIIHELLLARHAELLSGDIESMIHAHPTISEALMEAARGVDGRPVHG